MSERKVCNQTGEVCTRQQHCQDCLVPVYMWMLENKVRE